MGNALERVHSRHKDTRNGHNHVYNQGLFGIQMEQIERSRKNFVLFDLGVANADNDAMRRPRDYQGMMTNVKQLILYSKSACVSGYNQTPGVLLYLSPQLKRVDIKHVNVFDLVVIDRIFPLLSEGATVCMNWDQMERLRQRNPHFLDNVSCVNLFLTATTAIGVESWVFLHEWASTRDNQILQLHIQRWTIGMQVTAHGAYREIVLKPQTTAGLHTFEITMEDVDHEAIRSPGQMGLWSLFVNTETITNVACSVSDVATPLTVVWISELMNTFMSVCHHVYGFHYLYCEWNGEWNDIQQIVNRMVVNFVEGSRNAFLSTVDDLQPDVPFFEPWDHLLDLELKIDLPKCEMKHFTHRRPEINDYRLQDANAKEFTQRFQNAMFHEDRIKIEFVPKPKRGAKRKEMS
jgi:hypothetical protein